MGKMSSGFPSDILRLLCLSAAFYSGKLSPTTTHCWNLCELRQSSRRTSEGKPEDIFPVKYDLGFTKIAVLCDVLLCIVTYSFLNPWVAAKVTYCCPTCRSSNMVTPVLGHTSNVAVRMACH